MKSDKEIKAWFREEASKHPGQYYPVETLKTLGFSRRTCQECGAFFWSTRPRPACGEPACEGGYSFIGRRRRAMTFLEVWSEFAALMGRRGYTAIPRYPVVARWHPTVDFVIAGIVDFQPYVVSGEVAPPANPVVEPQICLRFNDIDNVGVTGRHYTGFTMIGQHAFFPKAEFNQGRYFEDYLAWFTDGMGLALHELAIHEDAWAGGGNFGPCLEFFAGGLELGNQVYMLFEQTEDGYRDLPIRVLDMGMGQERPAWFLTGAPTSYDLTFPSVIAHLLERTGIQKDEGLLARFVPLSGLLNLDEAPSAEAAWARVGAALKTDPARLKAALEPLIALYALADHTRTLLYALADGALPSNVGGGYNLRLLYRRLQGFLETHQWTVEVDALLDLHADYLRPQYPEFAEKAPQVKRILAVEARKYAQAKERSKTLIQSVLAKRQPISAEQLITLYDSQGLNPEDVAAAALEAGVPAELPPNFYALVAGRHEGKAQKTQTGRAIPLRLDGLPETRILYYDNYRLFQSTGTVLRVQEVDGKAYVVLDQTIMYPTSGGQLHDLGTMNGAPVLEVFKMGPHVIHALSRAPFKEGDVVECRVDEARRVQLAQHHTATHIINGAAKALLGGHVWQAGAAKTPEKARIDLTHYDLLTDEELHEVERRANDVVRQNLPVHKYFLPRDEAERRFGFSLYQGGAVPGKKIRILEIPGVDAEACGGTHLDFTGEAEAIKILRQTKVQDGLVRLEFVAGAAAKAALADAAATLANLAARLACDPDQVPCRIEELFEKWKRAQKTEKKGQPLSLEDRTLISTGRRAGSAEALLGAAAKALNTQPEHLAKTAARFLEDLRNF